MPGPHRNWLAGALVIGVLAMTLPIRWLTADEYSAYAAGIQTFGLVLTLLLGYQTLRSELFDRRVDRTLELHREFVTGEVGEARVRLVQAARVTDPPTPIDRLALSRTALQAGDGKAAAASYEDVVLLLRFFERVEATRRAGSLDELVAASLIGSHAGWWDKAILPDAGKARQPLRSFARWSNSVARAHPRDERFKDWGSSTSRDWGPASD